MKQSVNIQDYIETNTVDSDMLSLTYQDKKWNAPTYIPVGSSKVYRVELTNISKDPISNIVLEDLAPEIEVLSHPYQLAPGQTLDIELKYTPSREKELFGDIYHPTYSFTVCKMKKGQKVMVFDETEHEAKLWCVRCGNISVLYDGPFKNERCPRCDK